MNKPSASTSLMLAGVAFLVAFAWYLAANRMYQVDEAQNLFMIRVLGSHQTGAYFSNALLWMLGPLAWKAASATSSVSLFLAFRMVFFAVFLANLLLLAMNTGVRLRSNQGLLALLGAATLAPLWDYGFEIRHDNLILLGLLLMWWLGRTSQRGGWSYLGLGFLSVVLIFTAFKAFAYVVPLSLVFLAVPPPDHGARRSQLLAAWLGGALAGVLLVFVSYQVSGFWPTYLAGFQSGRNATDGGQRFGAGLSLERLVNQTPLLLGLAVSALLGFIGRYRRNWKQMFTWNGWLPEALLALGALGVLFLNPTPFPYNLVNLVPFLFLLVFRFGMTALHDLEPSASTKATVAGVLLCTHLIPFSKSTWRHLDWGNDRQELLMQVAESLTDPAKDPVYDAIGMVPTRPAIGFHWYLHSLNLQAFAEGRIPSVARMLEERPAPVFIRSYRTEWLPEADQRFIQARYLPLADDLWVLGKVLPKGGGDYSAVHPGRYQVLNLNQGRLMNLTQAVVDGKPLRGAVSYLETGNHLVTTPPETQPVVLWVGPRLDRVPVLGRGDHLRLFVNWY